MKQLFIIICLFLILGCTKKESPVMQVIIEQKNENNQEAINENTEPEGLRIINSPSLDGEGNSLIDQSFIIGDWAGVWYYQGSKYDNPYGLEKGSEVNSFWRFREDGTMYEQEFDGASFGNYSIIGDIIHITTRWGELKYRYKILNKDKIQILEIAEDRNFQEKTLTRIIE